MSAKNIETGLQVVSGGVSLVSLVLAADTWRTGEGHQDKLKALFALNLIGALAMFAWLEWQLHSSRSEGHEQVLLAAIVGHLCIAMSINHGMNSSDSEAVERATQVTTFVSAATLLAVVGPHAYTYVRSKY